MDWITQYSAALAERDVREQAHKTYIDAYSRLADKRSASVDDQARPAAPMTSPVPQRSATTTPTKAISKEAGAISTAPETLLAQLRSDLTATQKVRSTLQAQVTELVASLQTLTQQNNVSMQQIALLTKQKTENERRLCDKDEELRGKAKLVERAQDEMIAQGLQLNVAEEKMEQLKKDNAELVERWMRRVGDEAEKVNRDSRWE